MSGLAGMWRVDGKPAADACRRMLRAQEIYGPHDGRQWCEGAIAMGRRLFRTLPEDEFDRQPLHSADRRLTIVADVRLDNRDELCVDLGIGTRSARRLCDAAVLLECLASWGEGALDRIVGDFAFALWDSPAQKLLLVRDFLGQRPLHFHRGKGFLAFASMPKGLHAVPETPCSPDEQAVSEFIALIPEAGSASFFKGIERVEAGCVVTVTRGGLASRRYWNPVPVVGGTASNHDYAEGLRDHLDQATRSRLRGVDGAVGAQLSAGFDSAAVTATAARLLAPAGGKVVAFTAVPRDGHGARERRNRISDEGPLAAATAGMYENIEHVLIRGSRLSPVEDLDRLFFLFDRPTLNLPNWTWTRAISEAARDRKLTVLLTGQMGNMTISYNGVQLLPDLFGGGRLFRLWRSAAELVANGHMRWRGALAHTLGPYIPVWLWQRINGIYGGRADILGYTAIRRARLEGSDLPRIAKKRGLDFSYRPRKDGFKSRLWAMRRFDPGNYNKGILAGWGVDQRDPTADRRLAEYCLSVPMDQYLAAGETRMLARRALRDRLPAAVLNERRKGYQAADWHEGLCAARDDIVAELDRLGGCPQAAEALDIERLRRLVDEWPDGGWERDEVISAYRLALLRGVAAGHFLRKASGSNA